ncbi:MAG TPA: transposase [Tepidisphaeraceae bacterium]|nr:transposase [Tepidisphaeraceae bacterium]
MVDACGTTLAVCTTAANVRDEQAVPTLLHRLAAMGLRVGSLHGDRGYGFPATRRLVADAGIEPVLAERADPGRPRKDGRPRRVADHGSGLGVIRRVVEQTLANFGHSRRIKLCYEKCHAHFQAFHDLTAAMLCYTRLRHYRSGL